MKIELKGLDTYLYKYVLDNGLSVYLVPLSNKKNYYINYATRFGSEDLEFIPAGDKKYVKVPDGIAHFLEHKMFESEDEIDPFTFFSQSGTDSNAATSYTSTQYYCIGNKNFLENLSYLLSFVNSPYYTDENVEKEKGIIAEELKMYQDIPDYKLETKLRENIYHTNPRRIDIGGTVESVYSITKEDLYLCYNNFYSPNNMCLFVVGNFDMELALNIIKESMKDVENRGDAKLKSIKEKDNVRRKYEEITCDNIAVPKVAIGLKINNSEFELDKFTLDLYLNMISSIKFGSTSIFREIMRDENVANSIYIDWERTGIHNTFYISGNCNDSDRFIDEVKKEFNNKEYLKEDFERIKKVWISNEVRSYDDVEGCLDSVYEDVIKYGDVIKDKIDIIRNLDFDLFINICSKIDFTNLSIVKMNLN